VNVNMNLPINIRVQVQDHVHGQSGLPEKRYNQLFLIVSDTETRFLEKNQAFLFFTPPALPKFRKLQKSDISGCLI